MKVDRSNYFVATAAEFRSIPASWTRRLLEGGEGPVKLGNMAFSKIFTSENPYWGSVSVYWESADGSTLVRVSDHWSTDTCVGRTARGVKLCGRIRSCFWRLSGHMNPVRKDWKSLSGGIVRYDSMRWLGPQEG